MKICFFGIYNPNYSRNKIIISGLKGNGVELIECRTDKKGLFKYFDLVKKHWRLRKEYDIMIVSYPGFQSVILAKFLTRKPIIFDALCTMYEGVILSRGQSGMLGIKSLYIKFVDWLAVKCADVVLVESENQKIYFEKIFGKSSKYKVIYTGADDGVFYKDDRVIKKEKFTVVFRGKFLPEAGVQYVIDTAKILEAKQVDFVIIGNGFMQDEIKAQIGAYKLANLQLISENLSYDELRIKMLECHISLGQLADHERLERTIPHKCFETLAMGLPYVTAKTSAVAEILTDGENCLFVNPADPKDLAEKILMLKNNSDLMKKIGDNGYELYKQKFTPKMLAKDILDIIL